jgi:hypothetical protein
MEPHGHLAVGEGIGQALAEAQFAALDHPATAAALRAAARCGFEDVEHAESPSDKIVLVR